jgi:hypothetical protein
VSIRGVYEQYIIDRTVYQRECVSRSSTDRQQSGDIKSTSSVFVIMETGKR